MSIPVKPFCWSLLGHYINARVFNEHPAPTWSFTFNLGTADSLGSKAAGAKGGSRHPFEQGCVQLVAPSLKSGDDWTIGLFFGWYFEVEVVKLQKLQGRLPLTVLKDQTPFCTPTSWTATGGWPGMPAWCLRETLPVPFERVTQCQRSEWREAELHEEGRWLLCWPTSTVMCKVLRYTANQFQSFWQIMGTFELVRYGFVAIKMMNAAWRTECESVIAKGKLLCNEGNPLRIHEPFWESMKSRSPTLCKGREPTWS